MIQAEGANMDERATAAREQAWAEADVFGWWRGRLLVRIEDTTINVHWEE